MNSLFSLNKNLATSYLPLKITPKFLFGMTLPRTWLSITDEREGWVIKNKPSRANFRTAFLSDSEQIEAIGTKFLCRNSVSVEEIQDRHERSERWQAIIENHAFWFGLERCRLMRDAVSYIIKKRTHYPMNSLFSLNKNLATSYLPRKWPSKYFHRNESLRPCSGWERVFSSRLVTKNVVVTISIAWD